MCGGTIRSGLGRLLGEQYEAPQRHSQMLH